MGSIPANTYYENTIPVNEVSKIQIPLTKFGNDSEQFTLDMKVRYQELPKYSRQ